MTETNPSDLEHDQPDQPEDTDENQDDTESA